MQSRMKFQDFEDPVKISRVHAEEIGQALKQKLGASHVYVMDHVVRRRHPTFPISTGQDYQYDQLTAVAHIDAAIDMVKTLVKMLYDEGAREILSAPWQIVKDIGP